MQKIDYQNHSIVNVTVLFGFIIILLYNLIGGHKN